MNDNNNNRQEQRVVAISNSNDNMVNIANNNQSNRPKRGKYVVVNPQHKLLLAKQAARNGIQPTIDAHDRLQLKYATVGYWRAKYARAKREAGTSRTTSSPLFYCYAATCHHNKCINTYRSRTDSNGMWIYTKTKKYTIIR